MQQKCLTIQVKFAWIFRPIHLLSVDCNYMETWFIAKIAVLARQPEKGNQAEIYKSIHFSKPPSRTHQQKEANFSQWLMGNFIIMKKKKKKILHSMCLAEIQKCLQWVPQNDKITRRFTFARCPVNTRWECRLYLVFTLHSPHFLKMETFSRITNMCRRDKSSTRCFGICLSDQMTAFDGLWIDVQIKDTARDHRGWQQIFTSSGETIGEQMEREGGSKRHCLSNGPLCCLICSWWNKETRRTEGGEHEQVMRSSKGAGSEDAQPQRKAATVFVSN